MEITRSDQFLRDEVSLCQYAMAALKPEKFEDFRDRRRLGLLENPIAHVKRPRVNDNRVMRFYGDEEQRLMEALEDCRNSWVKPAAILALKTAMRRGELLSLQWEHVNLDTCVAQLPDTKNGETRDVPLSSTAIRTLKSLPRAINGAVLPTTPEGLKNAFERARKRADLEHFNFHDLRHESISRLFEAGGNVMEVAAVSGHKDLQSLKRYTNLKATDLAKKMG